MSSSSAATAATSSLPASPYICFDHAVAGLGILTDHGTNQRHGQYLPDYFHPHNAVRGPIFYDFRNWVVQNLRLTDHHHHRQHRHKNRRRHHHHRHRENDHAPIIQQQRMINITVAINSTKDPFRYWNTQPYLQALQSSLKTGMQDQDPSSTFHIQAVQVSQLSAVEQIQLALDSTIYVTVVGGGSVTAMWLPPGASLILFYPVLSANQTMEIVESMTKLHKRGRRRRHSDMYLTNVRRLALDWDVWNHLSYIRVHWLPLPASRAITTTTTTTTTTTAPDDGNITNTTTTNTNTTTYAVVDAAEEERSIRLLLHLIRHETRTKMFEQQ